MKKLFFIFSLIILAVAPALLVAANTPVKTVFPNGLTLIHQYDQTSEVVALDLFVKAGAGAEEKNQAGIANFIQNLLYNGTTSRTAKQIAFETESIGASISGSCAEDYALVRAVVFKEYFELMTEVFFDGVLNPTFPQEEVEKERANILASIKTRQDSIFNVAFDQLNEEIYGEHPYHKPIIGYKRTLQNITRKQIIAFYQQYYRPQNMILVVVGNISPKKITKLLKKYFPALAKTELTIQPINAAPATPTRFEPREMNLETKFKQAYLIMGYLVPSVSSQDYPVFKIIATLLGGGMNSRLFVNLREQQGLAYELDSFYPSRAYASVLCIYLGLKETNLAQAQSSVRKEINALKTIPVSPEELNSVKTYLAGQYLLSRQTNQSLAFYLGFYELLQKGYEYDSQYLTDLQAVTANDISQVANDYFSDNNLTRIKLIPQKNTNSGGTSD
ncbi:MAG: insulinase family protein [Elusimicrobia bacterium]|nr:insulinase family protein [Elusimicrobiota bacterium]